MMAETLAKLYYESHVTIAPVFGRDLDIVKMICEPHGFRVASLVMKKDAEGPEIPSRDDTFCSSRNHVLEEITQGTVALCRELIANGYTVLRAKVEDTVWDTRISDLYSCLK
jgi:hypothetical protein